MEPRVDDLWGESVLFLCCPVMPLATCVKLASPVLILWPFEGAGFGVLELGVSLSLLLPDEPERGFMP